MSTRVPVKPDLLEWASTRAAVPLATLRTRFPKYDEWRVGDLYPTMKQLQNFAKATHTPIGYLFLDQPPQLEVPIPDFRTIDNDVPADPSPDLLDTIYACQQRQEWYRDYARSIGNDPLDFVGALDTNADAVDAATQIRERLRFSLDDQKDAASPDQALSEFRRAIEGLGILVMINGVVGSNTRRKLDPDEFRGFALSDPLAPVIFVNGADTRNARMFTLAHELAHVWLGESALSNVTAADTPALQVERWCNGVAAELLLPLADIQYEYDASADVTEEAKRIGRRYRVSSLVVLRRVYDGGFIDARQFREVFRNEAAFLRAVMARNRRSSSGGDWYRTTPVRVSERFARAVLVSSAEGRSSYGEAMRLLGCRKMSTFRELGSQLGVWL